MPDGMPGSSPPRPVLTWFDAGSIGRGLVPGVSTAGCPLRTDCPTKPNRMTRLGASDLAEANSFPGSCPTAAWVGGSKVGVVLGDPILDVRPGAARVGVVWLG